MGIASPADEGRAGTLSPTALTCIGYLKLKQKAIDDGVEPPAKKRTLAQCDDMPLCKVCILSNIFL